MFEVAPFDEQVVIYKPHPKVYQLALDGFGLSAAQIAFQYSNAWDAHAASGVGIQFVWRNRSDQGRERLPDMPDRCSEFTIGTTWKQAYARRDVS